MTDRLRQQWEANAAAFAALIGGQGTPHHREILNPCVEQLMGDVKGLHLLDAGCGEGYLARYYAERGARVVGVDFSPKLIDLCQQQSKKLAIEYHVGDICNLSFLKDRSFQRVLCNLVLLNVEHYDKALAEFYRVLEPTGFLVFSIVHPAFNIYGPGKWELTEKDPKTGRRTGRYFVVDRYFEEMEYSARWSSRTGEDFPQEFSFFHRPISSYAAALFRAGFHLAALEEPKPVTSSPFFEREQRIPFFLVFKAVKPG